MLFLGIHWRKPQAASNPLLITFKQQEPSLEDIEAIHEFIKNEENWSHLIGDGLKLGILTLCLPQGQDFISLISFNSAVKQEWCLLKQACHGHLYNFITIDSAEGLVRSAKDNPLTREALRVGDILRGKDVLAKLILLGQPESDFDVAQGQLNCQS